MLMQRLYPLKLMFDILQTLTDGKYKFISRTFPNEQKRTLMRTINVNRCIKDDSVVGMICYYRNNTVSYKFSHINFDSSENITTKARHVPLDIATAEIKRLLNL